jgi:RNA polymerase sigma factor (sigma-70 family)
MEQKKPGASSYTKNYRTYYPLVSKIISSKVYDSSMRDDLCQEVFTRYYLKFDSIENHGGWLVNTARLVFLEYYQGLKMLHNHIPLSSLMDDFYLAAPEGDNARGMIAEAMQENGFTVNERDRTLIDLIAVRQLSRKSAGEQIGLSERQARYRYERAVCLLTDHLRRKGVCGVSDLG